MSDVQVRLLENNIISMRIPIHIKHYHGKKVILLPDGGEWIPTREPYHVDDTLMRALAKAYYWQSLLDDGRYQCIKDLSKKRKINASYLSRILRLNQLSPKIKKAILDGTQPRQLNLQYMLTPFSDIWEEQLQHFGFN